MPRAVMVEHGPKTGFLLHRTRKFRGTGRDIFPFVRAQSQLEGDSAVNASALRDRAVFISEHKERLRISGDFGEQARSPNCVGYGLLVRARMFQRGLHERA